MTTRYDVAAYWCSPAGMARWPDAPGRIDLGEPSCFACGYYCEHWDKPKTPRKRWEAAALDRAHIIAESDGGTDDPSNLLLLCRVCHDEAPMTNDPAAMFAWVERRPPRDAQRVTAYAAELRALGVDVTAYAPITLEEIARAWSSLGIGSHGYARDGYATSAASLALLTREIYRLRDAGAAPPREG